MGAMITTYERTAAEGRRTAEKGWDVVAIKLAIQGMISAGCALRIERKLQVLPGVISVRVSHDDRRAAVAFDPAELDQEEILWAIGTISVRGRRYRAVPLLSIGVAVGADERVRVGAMRKVWQ